jgi:hypothetical protein
MTFLISSYGSSNAVLICFREANKMTFTRG